MERAEINWLYKYSSDFQIKILKSIKQMAILNIRGMVGGGNYIQSTGLECNHYE